MKDLAFLENALILSIVRRGENILPFGDLRIEPGDLVIIIAEKASIAGIESFLQN